jgi:hypothetical protein
MARIVDRFLAVPTLKALILAGSLIVVFGAAAAAVYWNRGGDKPFFDYWVKVADSLINGALVTFLFGTLKLVIGVVDNIKFFSPAPPR